MKPIEIPRYVDDPVHLFFWAIDEVAPIILGLVVGMFVGSPMIFAFVGILITKVYSQFRDSRPEGFPLHFLYWNGFMPTKSKLATNPFIRRYYP